MSNRFVVASLALVAIGAVATALLMRRKPKPPPPPDARFAIAGRVLDRLGRPIGAARVAAQAAGAGWVVAGTDDEGRYVVRMASAAPARMRVEADGYVPEELAEVVPPQNGLEFVLARRLALEGVVRAHGQAAGGAEVTVAGASGTRTVEAGPDGAFGFAALAEGRYALRAALDDEAAYVDGVMVAAGDGGSGVVAVELQPATTVTGKLRDRAGRPIAGGEVTLAEAESAPLPRTVTSDGDGNFRFAAVLPGSYLATARADGFYPSEPHALRVGRTPTGVELRLDPGATIDGRVVDERAQPVAGAEVQVSGEAPDGTPIAVTASSSAASGGAHVEPAGELGILRGPIPYPPPVPLPSLAPAPKSFRTDDKGAFHLGGLPAGRLVVVATHPDFARGASEPLAVASGAALRVTVVLSRGVEARGRVTDEHGDPVAGAELSADDGATLAESDRRGEFAIAHLARATTVTVRAPGFLPATRAIAPSERGPFDVQLRRAEARLGGVVVDDRGTPLSAARVEIAAPPMAPRWATTDRSGRFDAAGLGPGPYRVTVTHADFAPGRFDEVAPGDDVRLALSPGGGVDGEVRDARLGGTPPGARLELTAAGDKPRLVSLAAGRFSVTALPPGRAVLVASAPGYVTLTRELDVVAGDRLHDVTVRDVRLELERGGAVVGRVRDDRGDAVADAVVTVAGRRTRTARDGAFRVDGVPPGRARVGADKGALAASDDVDVRAGEESRVELRLR